MKTVQQVLHAKSGPVLSVRPDTTVYDALALMARHDIGALLVLDGDRLSGMFSERDYARKVILLGRSSAETPVWQIMSAPVETVSPDHSIDDCMRLCTQRRIRHLPVVAHGKVIGVVSIGDLVKAVIDEQAEELAQLQRYIAG